MAGKRRRIQLKAARRTAAAAAAATREQKKAEKDSVHPPPPFPTFAARARVLPARDKQKNTIKEDEEKTERGKVRLCFLLCFSPTPDENSERRANSSNPLCRAPLSPASSHQPSRSITSPPTAAAAAAALATTSSSEGLAAALSAASAAALASGPTHPAPAAAMQKDHLSVASAMCLAIGFPPPCPAWVSTRRSRALRCGSVVEFEARSCCNVAAYFRECRGGTRSSNSAVETRTAG